jgi:hypothetical protein
MNNSRLFYSSLVLPDGRVFVAGGEYGNGAATAEVFDPLANSGSGQWTQINPPASLLNPAGASPVNVGNQLQAFVDCPSMLLADGSVLIAPVQPNSIGGTLIYHPTSNTWSNGPTLAIHPNELGDQAETSWVKLPDGSILSPDPAFPCGLAGTNSERYIPSLGTWIPDANLPVSLFDVLVGGGKCYYGELGAGFLLPNGRAFYLGANGHTCIYIPSGNPSPGRWVQGPDIPGGLVAADAPAAMMPNGKILCAVAAPAYVDGSGNPQFPGGTSFFEYDYTGGPVGSDGPIGSFSQVPGPEWPFGDGDSVSSYQCNMLVLPDGTVLYCHFEQNNLFYSGFGSQLYVYIPDGSPVPSGKPTINTITRNLDGSYHLAGTGLNGISAGAAFGDDAQMDSNYPLVSFYNLSDGTGHVDYGRTYNWSSTGVQTGNTPETTEFKTSPTLLPDTYGLSAIANGIRSDPYTFLAPAWVDFTYGGTPQNGCYANPFPTLTQGTNAVPLGGTILIKGPQVNANHGLAVSHERMTISKPMTITAVGGAATIGL